MAKESSSQPQTTGSLALCLEYSNPCLKGAAADAVDASREYNSPGYDYNQAEVRTITRSYRLPCASLSSANPIRPQGARLTETFRTSREGLFAICFILAR